MQLRDKVRVIGQFFAVQAKAFPFLLRVIKECFDLVLGRRWTNSQSPREIVFIPIPKGSLPIGELTVIGIESIRTFRVRSNEPFLLREGMDLFRGGVVDRMVADVS